MSILGTACKILGLCLMAVLCHCFTIFIDWYMKGHRNCPPQLYYRPGRLQRMVQAYCPLLQRPFIPSFGIINGHLQTLLADFRRHTEPAAYHREVVILKPPFGDGGCIGMDWYCTCQATEPIPDDAPVLVVFNDLGGDSHDGYCKHICKAAYQRGWRPVVLVYRGHSGLELKSPAVPHCGSTVDVHAGLWAIKRRYPNAALLAVAFAQGGLLLTRYLAEYDSGHLGGGAGLCAAAMVSMPFEAVSQAVEPSLSCFTDPLLLLGFLVACWCIISRGLARTFRWRQVVRRGALLLRQRGDLDMEAVRNLVWPCDVEEQLLSKCAGFRRLRDYHHACAARHFIPHIRTPTLYLVAADDPFAGPLPTSEVESNEATLLAVPAKGGHLGFLDGKFVMGLGSKTTWAEDVVVQFLQAALATQPLSPDSDAFW